MTADHQGNLHFVALLRYPEGIYYAFKPVQGDWQPNVIVDQSGFSGGHFFQLALAEGNRLNAVWQRSSKIGDVVYVRITTLASPLMTSPIPTIASPPKITPSLQSPTVTVAADGKHSEPTPTPPITGIEVR